MAANILDQIVSLCKRRGFIFPGSDIYGGLANTWDYGPYGAELKNTVKKLWWNHFIQKREDMVGLDASILMNPKVWESSGHVGNFSDPLVDCKSCKARHRGDKLLEEKLGVEAVAGKSFDEIGRMLKEEKISCPDCGKCDWTTPRQFNLMFKTKQGVTEESGADIYLRPETAQGIFVNFKNVQTVMRKKLPFGIGQIGKAFRNEITPGNFTFRTREFEQMEIEYFFNPAEGKWEDLFEKWKKESWNFLEKTLGISPENIRFRKHENDELSHYSKGTTDIEYKFPFGWGELCAAVAYRTNFDLSQHEKFSGENLKYRDPITNEEYIPHVMEPSFGADRVTLSVLIDAYTEEIMTDGTTRIVMKFLPQVAPVKVAVLPLMKKDGLDEKAHSLFALFSKKWNTEYDESGSIGKRYRRQDEIGTPFCITVDYETLENETITLRDRDTMEQVRIPLAEIEKFLEEKLSV
jgi:glycyl-tRNA synthetase